MRIEQIRTYKEAESQAQTLREHILIFSLRGAEHIRMTLPDGREYGEDLAKRPHMLLVTPGTRLDFSYLTPRETVAIWLDGEGMREHGNTEFIELLDGGNWVPLPRIRWLDKTSLPLWQCELARIGSCLADPHPRNLLLAHCVLARFFQHLAEGVAASGNTPTPAQELKRKIDEDVSCRLTLARLSRDCGYSRDHLRECFKGEFGIDPGEYRQRLRMGRVLEWIREGGLSLKEVARRAGFLHLSHFSALFRQTFGYPPREAIKRFRRRL